MCNFMYHGISGAKRPEALKPQKLVTVEFCAHLLEFQYKRGASLYY